MKNNKVVINTKNDVRDYAEEIGLPIFGVAAPDPLLHLEELLKKRKQEGLESPFEKRWQPDERCRPESVLPSVKSIICVGMPYYPFPTKTYPALWGIARFAWGEDYHILLKNKLELLAAFLVARCGPGVEYAATVDAVPLVERALAYRAGLGWYGKNNLLINPKYGSWFVLGELLTNIPLEPDTSIEGDCGACILCLEACPTNALAGPYELDSSRCISCLTQIKSPVPAKLREKVGKAMYGCDICQEVCPRNRQLSAGGEGNMGLEPEDFNGESLLGLFEVTNAQFREKYGRAAFSFAGKELLQRNAILALGVNDGRSYVTALGKALTAQAPQVRSTAAWALGHIGGQTAGELLQEALVFEKDEEVRKEISLAKIRQKSLK